MRAVVLDSGFGIDNLKLVERPVLEPGFGEVRVKMSAVSLNYRDWLLIDGKYNPRQTFPVVPVSDGAGIVDAVGPGVENFNPGDRVINQFIETWKSGPVRPGALGESRGGPGGDGVLSQYAVFRADGLLPVPDYLSLPEAATLACAGVTGWSAVAKSGLIGPGSSIVIQGTGGVAIFALQFAKLAGAKAAVLSSSDEKLASIRYLGADLEINYTDTPDWGKRIRDRFAPHGADVVVEVGGERTLEQSLRAVRGGGTICLIGVLTGPIAPLNLPLVVMRQVRLQGITVGSKSDMQDMLSAMTFHTMRPVIGKTFQLASFREAFDALRNGNQVGKVVISGLNE